MTTFQYFEIRPCVVTPSGETLSFLGKPVYCNSRKDYINTPDEALAEAEDYFGGPVFWTLYGRDQEGLALAIGDFTSFEAAYDVMNAIIAPMAAAWEILTDNPPDLQAAVRQASDVLEDFIIQCSSEERL